MSGSAPGVPKGSATTRPSSGCGVKKFLSPTEPGNTIQTSSTSSRSLRCSSSTIRDRLCWPGGGRINELDGPLSLVRGTLRYGLKMAVFLPALALCRTWRMEAVIMKKGERLSFALDDQSRLVSHFRRFPVFDSRLESDFAGAFQKAFERRPHEWRLAR